MHWPSPGGIGENSDLIRKKVLELMGVFGFDMSDELNEKFRFGNEGVITNEGSTVAMVVATNEELMIAQDTAAPDRLILQSLQLRLQAFCLFELLVPFPYLFFLFPNGKVR